MFRGSAWEWNEQRQQYYLHQFVPGQPDLNYRNPKVLQAMKDVIAFWLDLGVDGFRMDAVAHIWEDERLLDEPLSGNMVLCSLVCPTKVVLQVILMTQMTMVT